jgi:hypothetical protein
VRGSFESAGAQTVGSLGRFVADNLKFRPATAARFTAEAHACVRRSVELLLQPGGAAALVAALSWDDTAASAHERSQRHGVPAVLERALGDLDTARPPPSLLLLPPNDDAMPPPVGRTDAVGAARSARDEAAAAREHELTAAVASSATSPAASEAAAAKAKQQKALKSAAGKNQPANEPMLPPGAVATGTTSASADEPASSAPEQPPLPTFTSIPAGYFAAQHALSELLQKAGPSVDSATTSTATATTTASLFALSLLRAHLASCGPCSGAPRLE